MIFMTHPDHGAMHVYSPVEVLEHQKNGWIESTPEQWLASKAKPAEAAEPVQANPEAPKRPGRPPKNSL